MAVVQKMADKNDFFTITQSISNIFTFSLSLLVSHHITQISKKKDFLCGIKWRRKFKMGPNFQYAVTFFLMNIFSIAFLHCVCVKNEKKYGTSFCILMQDGATLPRG
jgi:cytochrome oxidase assembly protein ShyY1